MSWYIGGVKSTPGNLPHVLLVLTARIHTLLFVLLLLCAFAGAASQGCQDNMGPESAGLPLLPRTTVLLVPGILHYPLVTDSYLVVAQYSGHHFKQ